MSVTLKDVATAAGLSIRSVRRALENTPGLSPASRRRVLAVADELGYVPNIAARNLRMRKTPFVGLISSNHGIDVLVRRRFDLIDKLEKRGFNPLISNPPENAAEVANLMRRWSGITAAVVWLSQPDPATLEQLAGFPQKFILVDSDFSGPNCCSLTVDRAPGITAAIETLILSGRRRIIRCGNIVTRESGFRQAFRNLGELAPPPLGVIPIDESDFEAGYAAAPGIVASGADAVFFDVDRLAYGFLRYAYEHRIAVPQDIAVIGFDDDSFSRYCCPALSSVAHPLGELNCRIVELIENGIPGHTSIRFATEFVERASSAVIPAVRPDQP